MNLSPDSDFFRNVDLDALEQHLAAADRPDRPWMQREDARSIMDALMDSQRSETLDRTRSDQRPRRDFCQMPDKSKEGLVQQLIAAQQTAITDAVIRKRAATVELATHRALKDHRAPIHPAAWRATT